MWFRVCGAEAQGAASGKKIHSEAQKGAANSTLGGAGSERRSAELQARPRTLLRNPVGAAPDTAGDRTAPREGQEEAVHPEDVKPGRGDRNAVGRSPRRSGSCKCSARTGRPTGRPRGAVTTQTGRLEPVGSGRGSSSPFSLETRTLGRSSKESGCVWGRVE